MKNPLSKETLEQYRSMLPHGIIKEIVAETGLHPNSITNFFNGKSYNVKVEIAILKKIGKIKRERERLLKEAGF